MSKLTLKQINKFVESKPDTFEIDYGDFKVTAKTNLSIAEKQAFIDSVVAYAQRDEVDYQPLMVDVAFSIAVLQFLTDVPLPTTIINGEEVVDSEAAYKIANTLDIIEKYNDVLSYKDCISILYALKQKINAKIEFENQKLVALYGVSNATSEAIETFSFAMNKIVDLVNVAADQIDKNGNKLFKNLTPKKINEWINGIQKVVINNLETKE